MHMVYNSNKFVPSGVGGLLQKFGKEAQEYHHATNFYFDKHLMGLTRNRYYT